MKTILYTASSRGSANHEWLQTHHYFSFADYYNDERIHFGALRVINDDTIAGGLGFDTHPHDNMEIITIPFSGDLTHKDNMGNTGVIYHGDIQVMSAGTGIFHSEWNFNTLEPVTLFQIWIYPNKRNHTPRYQQMSIRDLEKENEFFQILSPNKEDSGVWINQNAWMNIGNFNKDVSTSYSMHLENYGVFAVVISGKATIEGNNLDTRDAIGIWETNQISIQAEKNSKILLIEVPMIFNK